MAGRVWPIHLYFRLLIEQNTATLEAILVGRFPFVWKNIFYGRKQNGTGLSTENFSESLAGMPFRGIPLISFTGMIEKSLYMYQKLFHIIPVLLDETRSRFASRLVC